MIDGMDGLSEYVRDVPHAGSQIVDASGWRARTPRASVVAHGHEERDEDGHLVGTRVSIRLTSSAVSGTLSSSSSNVLMDAQGSSGLASHVVVYLPMTETGTYVSDQIVDAIEFTARLEQPWVPPTVRQRPR